MFQLLTGFSLALLRQRLLFRGKILFKGCRYDIARVPATSLVGGERSHAPEQAFRNPHLQKFIALFCFGFHTCNLHFTAIQVSCQ